MFTTILSNKVTGSNHTKCVSLSNQKCMIQPTLINLHPNEYSQKLHYSPLVVKLDKCIGNCNTLNEVCVSNKTEDLNATIFNMIAVIKESKTLTKHISCDCKCKFCRRKCNSNQWWDIDK